MPVFAAYASPTWEHFSPPPLAARIVPWLAFTPKSARDEFLTSVMPVHFTYACYPNYRNRQMAKKSVPNEYVEPIGARVLVRKDEPKRETRGGIALPDAAEIPTITGRIVTISVEVENDEDVPLRQYDKILFHPKNAIPVDLEHDNQLFVVPVEDVVAVFRRHEKDA